MLPSAVGVDRHSPVTSRRAAVAPASEGAAPAPSPPPSPPHGASRPGACAGGVSGLGSLDDKPLLELPHMGARTLGERRASSGAAPAATDGAVGAADAPPPRRSRDGRDGRTSASQRPRRKFNLRFVALVKWDLACFLGCMLLCLAAVRTAPPPHGRAAAARPHGRTAAPPLHCRTSRSSSPPPSLPSSLHRSLPLHLGR